MVFYTKQMFAQFVKNELAESLKKVVNKLNKTDSVKDFLLPPNYLQKGQKSLGKNWRQQLTKVPN